MRLRHYWDDKYVRSLGLLVVIGALLTLSVWYVDKNARDDLRVEQEQRALAVRLLVNRIAAENINSCERGNDVRAYLIVEAGEGSYPPGLQDAARRVFRLVNCKETLRAGKPVFLTARQEAAYVAAVERRIKRAP